MKTLFINALTFLLADIFAADGVIFNCDFAYLSSGEIFKNRYACRMNEDNIIIEGSMRLVEVNGDHVEGQNNSVVRMVYANKQFGPCKLPQDMKKFFPNLDGIKWIHGSLSTIDADDLDFPRLDLLDLQDNKLVSLPSDLFKNSPKLQWIQLDNNAIAHVGRNFFDGLEELETIRFRSNPCMNLMAETAVDIEDLKSQLPFSCPSGPNPLRCTINDEVTELKIESERQEKVVAKVFDDVADNKKKTDQVKVQVESQAAENVKNIQKFHDDLEQLWEEIRNQNTTIYHLKSSATESKQETEKLKRQIIDQNDLVENYRSRLEKVENIIKYCQCVP